MTYLTIILLSIALSIDACIISFSYGLTFKENRLRNSLELASCTGIFQGIMPLIGYYLTGFVKSYIEPYANFITFGIFLYLGLKIIKETFNKEQEKKLCLGIKCLLLVGIATSIDAFSAGITLSLLGNHIAKPCILIAFITFINSLLGFYIGGKFRHLATKGLEIFAGILLISLGIKALLT